MVIGVVIVTLMVVGRSLTSVVVCKILRVFVIVAGTILVTLTVLVFILTRTSVVVTVTVVSDVLTTLLIAVLMRVEMIV